MPEIFIEDIPAAKPLFLGLEETHALVQAVTSGRLSARIFVDDKSAPSAGVIVYKSRILCSGNVAQHAVIHEMGDWLSKEIIPAHLEAGEDAYLVCYSSAEWESALEGMFDGCKIHHGERQYYEIRDFQSFALPALPDGFSIQVITHEFLSSGVKGLDAIREEMCSERLSVEDFLEHSFGLCPVYEDEVAGWCLSEYNIDRRCEIGIATLEKHQQKGIATLATRQFLMEAHHRGYTRVGWDCWKNNFASGATARKAGLHLVEEYPASVVVLEQNESQQKQG
jgi:hypothetical protein